jgi:exopolysaccharide biosynthesis polyprenyl glycosylphosphotransferase
MRRAMQAPSGPLSLHGARSESAAVALPHAGSVSLYAAKRIMDLIIASAVLVLTVPLSLVVALLVKLEDGGPVIFSQQRVGHRGMPFTLHKFRSMRVDAEAETGPTWAREDDPRVTRVGRWIRALRIDEIPQMWNVLRGEMSFVGPRPERPEFVGSLRAAIPFYDERHAVRPGITGWAQLHLPYAATVDDARRKLDYDLYYLKHLSIGLDLAIMVRTTAMILFGRRA